MRLSDIGTGLIGLGLGLWLAYEGRDLGLGEMMEPGSGFILFWVGLLTAALSAALAGSALIGSRPAGGEATDGEPEAGPAFGERWRRVPVVLGYLLVYAALLETVGFIVLTILLLILLFKTVERRSWTVAILYAAAATLTVYVVFGIGLGTQFPLGLLEPLLRG